MFKFEKKNFFSAVWTPLVKVNNYLEFLVDSFVTLGDVRVCKVFLVNVDADPRVTVSARIFFEKAS